MQVIQQELKAVGIDITAENLSSTTYDADVFNGKYQLAYDGNEVGRPRAVLRASAVALLEELRADRQVGVDELGALLQPERRRADRRLRGDDERRRAAPIVNQLEAAMVR